MPFKMNFSSKITIFDAARFMLSHMMFPGVGGGFHRETNKIDNAFDIGSWNLQLSPTHYIHSLYAGSLVCMRPITASA